MNPKATLVVRRYASRSQFANYKRKWRWGFTATFRGGNGERYVFQKGFDTKAEAQAAGQAWLDEKQAQYEADARADAILDVVLKGTRYEKK